MEKEVLFGDKPKRTYVMIPPLDLKQLQEPAYTATDDDLPTIFWPEPDLDEEPKC